MQKSWSRFAVSSPRAIPARHNHLGFLVLPFCVIGMLLFVLPQSARAVQFFNSMEVAEAARLAEVATIDDIGNVFHRELGVHRPIGRGVASTILR